MSTSRGGPISASQHLSVYAVTSTFSILAVIALSCRAYVVMTARRPVKWDDWTMFLCLIPLIGFAITLSVLARTFFLGTEPAELSTWLQKILILVWLSQLFLILGLYAVKLSICIRYLRLAKDLYIHFYRLTIVLLVFLSAHFISCVVVWGLQCTPITRFWNPNVPGTCIDLGAWALSVNAGNLATDVLVVVLPIPSISMARMPAKRKSQILAIFTVGGGITTVAGCMRFYYLHRFYAGQGAVANLITTSFTWCFAEISLGMFCGSIPSFSVLFMKAKSAQNSRRTLPSSDPSTLSEGPQKPGPFFSKQPDLDSVQVGGFDVNDDIQLVPHHPNLPDMDRDTQPSPSSMDSAIIYGQRRQRDEVRD